MLKPAHSLRQYLVDALRNLPGCRDLALHVLTSNPRKYPGLYAHSHAYSQDRPKVYQQDFLILVAEGLVDRPRTFISAMEASLFTITQNSSSILYISKVDSTGYGVEQPPPTRTLVEAFLKYHVHPDTRPTRHIRVQLFARAQNQYLFPNSSNHAGKKPLSDIKLCRWWRDVFNSVAQSVSPAQAESRLANQQVNLFYLLPGYAELEARDMISRPLTSRPVPDHFAHQWTYAHPYSTSTSALFSNVLSGSTAFAQPIDLFDIIPLFSDDPKARFLDELDATVQADHLAPSAPSTLSSPPRKRLKTRDSAEGTSIEQIINENTPLPNEGPKKPKRSSGISINEFWERMGYRQECSVGAVTGFFAAEFITRTTTVNGPAISSEDISSAPSGDSESPFVQAPTITTNAHAVGHIPSPMLARITTSLLNLDFGSAEEALQSTSILEESIHGLCKGLLNRGTSKGTSESLSATQVEESDEAGRSSSSFPEEGSTSLFDDHIWTAFPVRNPSFVKPVPVPPAQEPASGATPPTNQAVNVLQVRKKRKPA